MDRRQLLAAGAASFAANAWGGNAFAQASPKLKIDAYSRHLAWLRSAQECADAVKEMGYDGLDVTVRTYPGHVDPAKVKAELPPFVKTLRSNGLSVDTITTNISDADSPNAEAILDAASQLGIKHYWWGTWRYDLAKPIQPQIDALKPRVAALARLNEKYGMKAMYHNYSGAGGVGNMIFDLLEVLQNFDPRWVSFHYDTGHAVEAGANGTWELGLRAANAYVGGVSFKDYALMPAGPDDRSAPSGPPPGAPGAEAAPGGRRGRGPGGPGPGGPGGGNTNPWRSHAVPLGAGMVDLPRLAQVLKDINFSGPVEIQAEYSNGGADAGLDKITLPRDQVLGAMKRDLATLKAVLGPAGLI